VAVVEDPNDEMLRLIVKINGTDKNPWHKLGMKSNPFPQLAIAEFDKAEMQLNSLDGDRVTGPEDIRERLKGFSEEFIKLCIDKYKPGERVSFAVKFRRSRVARPDN
jgi:hypothetical protein